MDDIKFRFQKQGYERLANVLSDAFDQAAHGKGHARHATNEPFHDQVIMDMGRRFGIGSPLGQAFKKSEESQRLPYEKARAELLGAINYIAASVLLLDEQAGTKSLNPAACWPFAEPIKRSQLVAGSSDAKKIVGGGPAMGYAAQEEQSKPRVTNINIGAAIGGPRYADGKPEAESQSGSVKSIGVGVRQLPPELQALIDMLRSNGMHVSVITKGLPPHPDSFQR